MVVVIFEATMRSLIRRVSSIDALGTKKACTRKARTRADSTSAETTMMAVSPASGRHRRAEGVGHGPRHAEPAPRAVGQRAWGSRADTAIRTPPVRCRDRGERLGDLERLQAGDRPQDRHGPADDLRLGHEATSGVAHVGTRVRRVASGGRP